MRDSFIFYRSFFESFENLSKKDKLLLFDAVCNYALNDIVPELNGTPAAIFKLLKPQLDANTRRYENGLKGGRPRKTETKPKENQTETKSKRNVNDNVNDNVNVNVNVNENENVNENVNENHNPHGLGSSRGGGDGGGEDVYNIFKRLGADGIDKVYDVYPDTGGDLIQAVYEDVKAKRKQVTDPVAYVLGYAKRVGWDDSADHFDGGLS